MKFNCFLVLLINLLVTSSAFAQGKPKLIGEIEFFGAAGSDLNKIKAALPFHEGDEFSIEAGEAGADKLAETLGQAVEAIKQTSGQPPTDIAPTCCDDQGNWIIFIGLSGKTVPYNSPPKAFTQLPENIVKLYERFGNALMDALQKGVAAEDTSKGYALSEYLPLRSIQLEMRAYAVDHEALLRRVLETSADDQQRIVAAQLLGYARQSKFQITALARASHDGNGTVRNNATRALLVLAASNPNLAAAIPAENFIALLSSGTWTDLNKAGFLLFSLTKSRNPKLLAQLRNAEVLERLREMALWRTGHAEAARYILGRIAGIDEGRLQQLVTTGNVEAILNKLPNK